MRDQFRTLNQQLWNSLTDQEARQRMREHYQQIIRPAAVHHRGWYLLPIPMSPF